MTVEGPTYTFANSEHCCRIDRKLSNHYEINTIPFQIWWPVFSFLHIYLKCVRVFQAHLRGNNGANRDQEKAAFKIFILTQNWVESPLTSPSCTAQHTHHRKLTDFCTIKLAKLARMHTDEDQTPHAPNVHQRRSVMAWLHLVRVWRRCLRLEVPWIHLGLILTVPECTVIKHFLNVPQFNKQSLNLDAPWMHLDLTWTVLE